MDFTDGPAFQKCADIENELGPEMVTYSSRSIVFGRDWDFERDWVKFGVAGERWYRDKFYAHTPLIVRSDTITNLKQVLASKGKKLTYPIETLERPVDVTHLWPLDLKNVGDVSSILRSRVSNITDKINNNPQYTILDGKERRTLNNFVGLAGDAIREGRRGVKSAYIEALLSTKILIVTQRDGWEDHYRLFEGLVGGPMVLMDLMYSLPKGLENGTHVVEFSSEEELISLALYYLNNPKERIEIARRGRLEAMSRHRSWHRMEQIIFGDTLSRCKKDKKGDCPFIEHANETWR